MNGRAFRDESCTPQRGAIQIEVNTIWSCRATISGGPFGLPWVWSSCDLRMLRDLDARCPGGRTR
jgi:hypothetical protein